jgi:RecB family exonuclease
MVAVAPLDTTDRPPMVASLSPSSMSTWHQCPKRFFFEKIRRLPTDTNEAAVCGSFVHLVLQHLMDLAAPARTQEAAREIARSSFPAFAADPESRFHELELGPVEVRGFKHRAWAGITGYFRLEDPARVAVVATEQELRADLGGAPVYGIVDRLDHGRDGLVVTDYKSGKAPQWDDEREEKLQQLRTYAALLEAAGHRVAELRLLFLSPQLAAAAKHDRCRVAADDALDRLCEAVPAHPRHRLVEAVHDVDAASRAAREAVPEGGPAAREAGAAAALATAAAVARALDEPAVESLLLDAWAARRKAFFAGRALDRARPGVVALRVRQADLEMACAEAGEVWAEASACYEAWDFPGHTGPLCHFCPFADRCDAFQASIPA